MMRYLFAAMAAVAAVGSPIPLAIKDMVHVQAIQQGAQKFLQVDLTEQELEDTGLVVSTAVDFKIEVKEGVAVVNNEVAIPVGMGKFELKTMVKEYEMTPSGMRLATAKEAVPVALKVASHVVFDLHGHLHLKLQVYGAEGRDLTQEHYAAVEIVLDQNNTESDRITVAHHTTSPIPASAIEKAQKVHGLKPKHRKTPKLTVSLMPEFANKQHETNKVEATLLPAFAKEPVVATLLPEFANPKADEPLMLTLVPELIVDDADVLKHHGCKFVQWYKAQPVGAKVAVQIGSACILTLIAALLVCCCRKCCCASKAKRTAVAKNNYAKNIQASSSRRVFVPIKQYKYQKVSNA